MIEVTARQRKFADSILRGESGVSAARNAGVVGDTDYCSHRARLWLASKRVKSYLERQRSRLTKADLWQRGEMLAVLRGIADDASQPAAARIAAITAGARMLGFDSPVRVSVEVVPNTLLEQIREAQARREEAATVGA